ncbi:uncharacterized protein LOC124788659 [Schistocerca piceifrons]|uniref:uncharacterized protein LOC124788659 n=1 Tax=Schistocerca piceifrons TaxID=274613 RepID=UPI001F5F164A|nr:uncharacterized protein LOC124788659 [Schistocerca piceifrons]
MSGSPRTYPAKPPKSPAGAAAAAVTAAGAKDFLQADSIAASKNNTISSQHRAAATQGSGAALQAWRHFEARLNSIKNKVCSGALSGRAERREAERGHRLQWPSRTASPVCCASSYYRPFEGAAPDTGLCKPFSPSASGGRLGGRNNVGLWARASPCVVPALPSSAPATPRSHLQPPPPPTPPPRRKCAVTDTAAGCRPRQLRSASTNQATAAASDCLLERWVRALSSIRGHGRRPTRAALMPAAQAQAQGRAGPHSSAKPGIRAPADSRGDLLFPGAHR